MIYIYSYLDRNILNIELPIFLVFPHFIIFWAIFFGTKYFEASVVFGKICYSCDKASLLLITWTSRISRFLAIGSALFFPRFSSEFLGLYFSFYLGVMLIVLGQALRYFSIKQLGTDFTGNITVPNNLITIGLYKRVRHPAYLGGLIFNFGYFLCMGVWINIFLFLLPNIAVMAYRIHHEEKVLLNIFGQEYATYRKKSYRLIPYVL